MTQRSPAMSTKTCNHEMNFGSVSLDSELLDIANFHKRLFLEAWLLPDKAKDPQSRNDHIAIPEVHKSLARAYKSRATFSRNFTQNFPPRALTTCFF